ncbi:hypothetical protein OH708_21275 [Pseudomonas capsici]|uniref:hypothetical protein n=1 Tax=Pseudomonas capsici TaxID=2810614 RepID=UPI0021F11B07|nr:hypothetical protein [Pseudomonas capsici]MCV4290448.1 hypothetical protein [Pseudomonas capsici]
MKKNIGLLVRFDEEKRADLIKWKVEAEGYESFSDALSVADWNIGELSVALLSFSEGTIDYLCLARKRNVVVTSKSKVEFSTFLDLHSLPISAIEKLLPANLQRHFIRASQGIGGSIPIGTWEMLIQVIKSLKPDLTDEVDRILTLQKFSGIRLHGAVAEMQIQEREALGAALDIFSGNNKLRDSVLSGWAPPEEAVASLDEENGTAELLAVVPSFLEGISSRFLQEESAIQHDLLNWDGKEPAHSSGFSVFEQGGRKLSVIYANRNALEHTLGVDLIYYNERFELFVLVQYKIMRDEDGVMIYRPDAQLAAEMARMDTFREAVKNIEPIVDHAEYRLSDDGFLVKMVPNKGLIPASGELIKGMYLSREYMHFLIGKNGPKGPRGGQCISFENAPRYFTNSDFSSMVRAGWIGSRSAGTAELKRLIRAYYETNRAVMVAHEGKS